MSPHEEAQIKKDLIDHCPDQLKLPFALWTRQAVKLHIQSLFGIEMPIRTVGEYLKRWGFTPQKPVKRAYQRNDVAVQNWLENKFPDIKKQAKTEGADIFWGDETGIRPQGENSYSESESSTGENQHDKRNLKPGQGSFHVLQGYNDCSKTD